MPQVLAGSVIAASLGPRSAAVAREGDTLAEAISARSAAQLPAVARTPPRHDVEEALRSVTAATLACINALPGGSSALAHAAQ